MTRSRGAGLTKPGIALVVAFTLMLVFAIAACESATLDGTTWNGAIALTSVTIKFESGGRYTSNALNNGSYTISGDQVTLTPSGRGATRVFVLDGSLMRGTVDGWPCTLTKQ